MDEQLAKSMSELDAAIHTRQGADDVINRSNELLREYHEVTDPAGISAKRPKPLHADDYAYERTQMIKNLEDIVGDATMPQDVKIATQSRLNGAIEMLDEVRKADLSDARWREIRSVAQRKQATRTLNVILQDNYEMMMPLGGLADDIVIEKGLRQSLEFLWDQSNHKDFWPMVDTFTNLFKTYATATPGFHVRNAMSAVFVNSSDNVPVATQWKGARLVQKMGRAVRKGEFEDFWKGISDLERQSIEGAMGTGLGGRFFERGVGDRATLRYRAMEKAFENWFTEGSKRAGGFVESAVRVPVVMDTLIRGGSAADGMARARYLHFDYSQVSKFDERMKRLIPFWTFMSRNLPMQLSQMWTKPRTYAKYNHFIRNFRGDPAPNTPEYFEAIGAFRFGPDVGFGSDEGGALLGGLPLYLQPDFAHTRIEEDVENIELFSGENPLRFLSSFNPLFTTPAEFVVDKNFFTGRQYDENDVRMVGGLEKILEPLALALGQGEKTPNGSVVINEKFIDAFRSVLPLYDRSARVVPSITSGSMSDDQSARQIESWARLMGIPIRQLSPQQQRSAQRSERFNQQDERRHQRALLEAQSGR